MTVAVHSSRLQFTRDGGTLVVADPDGVALLGAGGDDQRRVAVAGVHAVAAFGDQVPPASSIARSSPRPI